MLLDEKIVKVKEMTHESNGRIKPLSLSGRRTRIKRQGDTVSKEVEAAISCPNIRTPSPSNVVAGTGSLTLNFCTYLELLQMR
jgi:hypothetical protein